MVAPTNILFIKLGSIGDIVLTIPALKMVKQRYPHAKLSFMVSESCKELVRRIRFVDEVVVTPDLGSGASTLRRISDGVAALRLAYSLRDRKYDVAINTLRSPVFALMCYVAGVREIITFDSGQTDPFSTKKVAFDLNKHHMMRIFDLVEVLGVPRSSVLPPDGIEILQEDMDRAAELMRWEGGAAASLTICSSPGGGSNPWTEMPSKRWGSERFARLYELLQREFDARIVLLGSGPDADIADRILKDTKARVLNLVGKTSLIDTMAILRMSHLYIGNDSGPLFIAAALGTPTLAVFGPTDASLINPPGASHTAVQSAAHCSPCYNPLDGLGGAAYRCTDYKCMEEISVERMFQAASEQLVQGLVSKRSLKGGKD